MPNDHRGATALPERQRETYRPGYHPVTVPPLRNTILQGVPVMTWRPRAQVGGWRFPGGSVPEDQIFGHLAPAEHQDLRELVLVRFAGDAAADDYMGGDALGPYRSRDDQADNVELGIWQQDAGTVRTSGGSALPDSRAQERRR